MSAKQCYLFCFLFSFLPLTPAFALDTEKDAPITIEADSAELDETKGISVYHGNVIVTQGGSVLSADKITIIRDENELGTIEANGSPAHFSQSGKEDFPETHAYGHTITFIRKDNLLKLEKEALLKQKDNLFRGDVIEYDTVKRIVKASGNEEKNTRVQIIVTPNQMKK